MNNKVIPLFVLILGVITSYKVFSEDYSTNAKFKFTFKNGNEKLCSEIVKVMNQDFQNFWKKTYLNTKYSQSCFNEYIDEDVVRLEVKENLNLLTEFKWENAATDVMDDNQKKAFASNFLFLKYPASKTFQSIRWVVSQKEECLNESQNCLTLKARLDIDNDGNLDVIESRLKIRTNTTAFQGLCGTEANVIYFSPQKNKLIEEPSTIFVSEEYIKNSSHIDYLHRPFKYKNKTYFFQYVDSIDLKRQNFDVVEIPIHRKKYGPNFIVPVNVCKVDMQSLGEIK